MSSSTGRAGATGSPLRNRNRRKAVPPSSPRASSTSSRTATKHDTRDWSTSEDSGGTDELLEDRDTVSVTRSKRDKAAKSMRTRSTRSPYTALRPVFRAARSTLRLVLLILPYLAPLLPCLLAAIVLYLGLAWARFQVASLLPNLPALLQGPLSHFADLSLPLPRLPSDLSLASLSALPCLNFGILCRDARSGDTLELLSASAARTAATRATHALDIFDHLVSLGSGDHAGHSLEPVAIWELATAVRYTSSLDDREFLSQQLSSLGDQSRDVKDHVISLNAQGLNAFSWVVHEFTRLEELITTASSPSTRMSSRQRAEFERLLSTLFDKISSSLSDLLISLDRAIPSATSASDSARRIFTALRAEEASTSERYDELAWFDKMLATVDAGPGGGKKVRMLRRDLELTRATAGAVIGVWQLLEGTRESLVSYSRHVEHYKAGLVGFHLSGHGLSVEDEVSSLKSVMEEMRATLDDARKRSGAGGRRGRAAKSEVKELPEA